MQTALIFAAMLSLPSLAAKPLNCEDYVIDAAPKTVHLGDFTFTALSPSGKRMARPYGDMFGQKGIDGFQIFDVETGKILAHIPAHPEVGFNHEIEFQSEDIVAYRERHGAWKRLYSIFEERVIASAQRGDDQRHAFMEPVLKYVPGLDLIFSRQGKSIVGRRRSGEIAVEYVLEEYSNYVWQLYVESGRLLLKTAIGVVLENLGQEYLDYPQVFSFPLYTSGTHPIRLAEQNRLRDIASEASRMFFGHFAVSGTTDLLVMPYQDPGSLLTHLVVQETSSGKPIASIPITTSGPLSGALAFSPSGRYLAVGSYGRYFEGAGLSIFDLSTPATPKVISLSVQPSRIAWADEKTLILTEHAQISAFTLPE